MNKNKHLENFYNKLNKDLYKIIRKNISNKKELMIAEEVINGVISESVVLYNIYEVFLYDKETYFHSLRVTIYSLYMGRFLRIDNEGLYKLVIGAILHDIGKTKVNKSIIRKKGKLSSEEFGLIKAHSTLGYNIIKNEASIPFSSKLIIIEHHERLDGSGYPKKKLKDEISEFSKIVAVADVYDALTSKRCYKRKMSSKKAIDLLKGENGRVLDDDYIDILINVLNIT